MIYRIIPLSRRVRTAHVLLKIKALGFNYVARLYLQFIGE